jgi:plasmid stabilization system protein ParE
MRLEFHPDVQKDLNGAIEYYENAGGAHLAERLKGDVRGCLYAVQNAPRQFGYYSDSQQVRRIRLKNFPYVIVYRDLPGIVRILVLKHEKRHPDHGTNRT